MPVHKLVLVVLLGVIQCTGGCARDFPYEVLLLEGDMQVVEYGLPKEINTRGVEKFPVEYVLRRSRYSVHAVVDRTQYSPTIIFWATDPSGRSLVVAGRPIKCIADFSLLTDLDPMKQKYPLAEHRFVWRPTDYGPCGTLDPADSIENEVVLIIESGTGETAQEIIPFRVIRNGTVRIYDST